MHTLFKTGLMVVLAGSVAGSTLANDQTRMEEERAKRRSELAQALTEMSRQLTAFDYLTVCLLVVVSSALVRASGLQLVACHSSAGRHGPIIDQCPRSQQKL